MPILGNLFNAAVVGGSLLFIILIGYIRVLTGTEWALSLFFLMPIMTATWYVGCRAGITLSLTSAATWLVADWLQLHTFSSPWVPFINELFRLAVFLILTVVVASLRKNLNQMKQLAMTDPLTGIANRRAFFDRAWAEMNRAQRTGRPFSVTFLDLDHFKEVNDMWGHYTGDSILKQVAETIRSHTRPTDIGARVGGDEFLLYLPDTNELQAKAIINRLQMRFAELMNCNAWPVTVSLGVVTFFSVPGNVDDVVREADQKMYEAKQGGRNQALFGVYPPQPVSTLATN